MTMPMQMGTPRPAPISEEIPFMPVALSMSPRRVCLGCLPELERIYEETVALRDRIAWLEAKTVSARAPEPEPYGPRPRSRIALRVAGEAL